MYINEGTMDRNIRSTQTRVSSPLLPYCASFIQLSITYVVDGNIKQIGTKNKWSGLTVLVACVFELFKTKTLFLMELSLKFSQRSEFKGESVLKIISTFSNSSSIQFWIFCCRCRFPPPQSPLAFASWCSHLCCSQGVGRR